MSYFFLHKFKIFTIYLLIIFAFGLCVTPIYPVIAAPSDIIPCGLSDASGKSTDDCDFNDVVTLINNIMEFFIFTLAMPAAVLGFAYAGYLYMVLPGKESDLKKAKSIFGYAFLGLVISLSAYLVITYISSAFLTNTDIGANVRTGVGLPPGT